MTHPIARYGIVLGMVSLAGCAGDPQTPTPIAPPPAVAPTPLAPSTPAPPPPNPGGGPLAGVYALTLDIGSDCDAVPASERTRRYTATLDGDGEGQYVVTLSDASFLAGLVCTTGSGRYAGMGCHQFFASEEGNTVYFSLVQNDDWHGGQIVEQLSSGTWLEITGNAAGTFTRTSMEASGAGHAWYCPTSSGYPFPCSRPTFCDTPLRLTLTRK